MRHVKLWRKCQQDSNVQTDICYANKCMNLESHVDNKKYRMASQATQVNFNQLRHKPSKGFKNQIAQCNLNNSPGAKNVFDMKNDDNALKDCKSPLVIISVYPRHGEDDTLNSPVKIIQHHDVPQKEFTSNMQYNIPRARKGQSRKDYVFSVNKAEQRSYRSRSPSPTCKPVRNKTLVDKTDETIFFGKNPLLNMNTKIATNNSVSPQRQRKVNKSTHKFNNMKKDVSCYCPYSKDIRNQELLKQKVNCKIRKDKETDTKEVKRALVNSFLKSFDRIDQYDKKKIIPKDTSKVAININGKTERYDVLLQQRNFDTDLTVRKTQKKLVQAYSSCDEAGVNSMDHFLKLSDEIKDVNNSAIYSRESQNDSNGINNITVSRLNIRDSLDICHSRDGKVGSRLKPTEIKGKYNLRDSLLNSDFLAPVKHYPGDDCSIPDPNERDREIRELLGIVRNKRNPKKNAPVGSEDNLSANHKEKSCCCRKKCSSKGLMTGLSISRFFASKCLKRKNKRQRILNESTQSKKRDTTEFKEGATQVSTNKPAIETAQKSKTVYSSPKELQNREEETKLSDTPPEELTPEEPYEEENLIAAKGKAESQKEDNIISTEKIEKNVKSTDVAPTERDNSTNIPTNKPVKNISSKEPVIEQNLILNRNIQVFLQVEQFTKQRPIILTRKQYDKVKKTIQCTISKNLTVEQRKRCSLRNCNVVSVGEIKVKPILHQNFRYDREVQTERSEIQGTVRCVQIQTQHNYKTERHKLCNTKQNKCIEKQLNQIVFATDSNNDIDFNKDVVEKHVKAKEITRRQTVSSMEIRYANVAYMKHITYSSTHFGDGLHNKSTRSNSKKANNSIHTIFKGHRKSATPNLGTSAYSLCSDVTDAYGSSKSIKAPPYAGDSKPKKPFLQRLISCLVMRSAETSLLKQVPARKQPSVNTSVDSYHISSSLGALEMTSSLYDTSASFYSNHTTLPINKIKRSFFSSVRGFLTTRRS